MARPTAEAVSAPAEGKYPSDEDSRRVPVAEARREEASRRDLEGLTLLQMRSDVGHGSVAGPGLVLVRRVEAVGCSRCCRTVDAGDVANALRRT